MNLLRAIAVFQQVAEHQSFSIAAEKLNLVPSAVSRQISELEKWLGIRLINRTTRSLHLTDDGRLYLAKMKAISEQVEELKSSSSEQQSLSGTIKLTAPMILGQQIVPKVLAKFKAKHPQS